MTPAQIVQKMKENGTFEDAVTASENDISGLVFIMNIAMGAPGGSTQKYGLIFEVMDELKACAV